MAVSTPRVSKSDLILLNEDGSEPPLGQLPTPLDARGSFGTIYLTRWGKKKCAFKDIPIPLELETELLVMQGLDHPNVMKVLALVTNEERAVMGYLMEYMPAGDLLTYLSDQQSINFTTVLQLAKDIAVGLTYLHANGVIHRDLHIKNILMRGTQAVIGDFNRGRDGGAHTVLATAQAGMIAIVPPECRDHEITAYNSSYDMYGYGFLVAQLARATVVGDSDWHELDEGDAWKKYHLKMACIAASAAGLNGLAALITRCAAEQPTSRPRADEVVTLLNTMTAQN